MFPSETMPRLIVRLPQDVKDWLAAEATRNSSSQNSEVVRALRERMQRAKASQEVE